ncbi:MAG: sigma-54 dependent transcriptional regulator [Alloacidobacterium sp.]
MEAIVQGLRDKQAWAKIIGRAPAFLNAIAKLPAIAKSDAAVLISGETGTGKELVARAIHYSSNRAACPFIAINCGSVPDLLLESELFGHERGAFTDAHARKRGLIEEAKTGTMFLDEVDSLSPKAQVSLLRVLQEKQFRPLGSTLDHSADVRIVAATNAFLKQMVGLGSFRVDLYYRLSVFTISLPPLRERREDILPLAEHFLKKHAPPLKTGIALSASALAALVAYEWPGNVRELENAIIRGVHLTEEATIDMEHLGLLDTLLNESATANSFQAAKRLAVDTFERNYLVWIMSEHHGNVSHAAQAAGKERRDLGKLLKKHGLGAKEFREGG